MRTLYDLLALASVGVIIAVLITIIGSGLSGLRDILHSQNGGTITLIIILALAVLSQWTRADQR